MEKLTNNNTAPTKAVRNNSSQIGSNLEGYIWCSLFVLEAIIIVALNILTVIVFIKKRCFRRRSTYLLINLSLADLCIGALVIPTSVFRRGNIFGLWKIEMSDAVRFSTFGIDTLFFGCSLAFLVSISIERLHAMRNPMRHRLVSSSSYRKWVFSVWVASVIYTTLTISLLSFDVLGLLVWFIVAGCVLACLLILTFCYLAIFVTVRRSKDPELTNRHGRTERKLTVTLFIVTLVSLSVWLPYVLFTFLETPLLRLLSTGALLRVRSICEFLFYANSFVNPILYTIRMPGFRKELRSIVSLSVPFRLRVCKEKIIGSSKHKKYVVNQIGPVLQGGSISDRYGINLKDLNSWRSRNAIFRVLPVS
ncbi:trace amine-associated receptor 9-like [Montipora foliosa]|uniref:trace amine-associated receptor 9-like n=1 Tax=Montipora foliosa TaxID=591990 RepID=UPI0035F16479